MRLDDNEYILSGWGHLHEHLYETSSLYNNHIIVEILKKSTKPKSTSAYLRNYHPIIQAISTF